MLRTSCLVVAAVAALALTACTRPPMQANQTATKHVASATPTPGETLAQLIALDQLAIARSEQARSHASLDAPVAELVETIHMHHRRNLSQTRALGDAERLNVADTPNLRAQRAEDLKRLKALDDVAAESYQRAYLESVVDDHEQALQRIDQHLEAAEGELLRGHLQRTRDHFSGHMDAAKALLAG